MVKEAKMKKYFELRGVGDSIEAIFMGCEMAILAAHFTDKSFGEKEKKKICVKFGRIRDKLPREIIKSMQEFFSNEDMDRLIDFYESETCKRERAFQRKLNLLIRAATDELEGKKSCAPGGG